MQFLQPPYEAGTLVVPISQRSKARLTDTIIYPRHPATAKLVFLQGALGAYTCLTPLAYKETPVLNRLFV